MFHDHDKLDYTIRAINKTPQTIRSLHLLQLIKSNVKSLPIKTLSGNTKSQQQQKKPMANA